MLPVALQIAITERYGVTLEIKIDLHNEKAGYVEVEHEILVGAVDREACTTEISKLHKNGDWLIALSDGKLVLCGKTPAATRDAVDVLIDLLPDVLPLTVGGDAVRLCRADSRLDSITLGKTELYEYAIVLPASATALDTASAVEQCDFDGVRCFAAGQIRRAKRGWNLSCP